MAWSPQRVCVLDPGLQTQAGHHFALDLAIVSEARRRGLKVAVYSHRKVDRSVGRALTAQRLFSYSPYDDPSPLEDRDLAKLAGRTAIAVRELEERRSELSSVDTLLLLHSYRITHLAALGTWLANLPIRDWPFVYLHNNIEILRGPPSANALERKVYIDSYDPYRQGQSRIKIGVPTITLQEVLSDITGIKPHVYPLAYAFPRLSKQSAAAGATLRIGWFGTARLEKGFALLPKIVRALFDQHSRVNFVIQLCPGTEPMEEFEMELRQIADRTDRLELVEGVLSYSKYSELLIGCGIVLISYDNRRYSGRTSSIFAEALAVGKPVVVPANSWMAEMLYSFDAGGAAFSTFSAESIVSALTAILRDYETQLTKTKMAQFHWRTKTGMEPFFNFMLGQSSNKQAGDPIGWISQSS
jgi:glycosyltransferase involved in cell wall biosynthesis